LHWKNHELRTTPERFLPLVLLLFVGSGCAALIYEIVWLQLLQLVIGSSAVSLGVLLGTFMGGMCLGSLLLPRLIGPAAHPLRVYAALELAIGAIGMALLFILPKVDDVYAATAVGGWLGVLLRGAVAAVCLLPPTLCMGATLPAVARWVETTPRGISWLGFFYGGNIAGAVLGCLLAGFYLLRLFDLATATYVAVGINLIVAGLALSIALYSPRSEVQSPRSQTAATLDLGRGTLDFRWTVYFAIALSGFCALGAEVIWTRLLSLMIGGTVYTFSIILAVFLTGLGLGSSVGSVLSREARSPRVALGICQFLLTAAIAWTAFVLARSLPYWPIDPSLSKNPWNNFQLDLVRCAWAVLPAAVLWGASFPLALAAAAGGGDSGRLVGSVYAANTLGAIAGALAFSVLLVGWMGTQRSQQILIGVSAAAAAIALVPSLLRRGDAASSAGPLAGALVMGGIGLSACLAYFVPATPGELIAHGRRLPQRTGYYKLLFQGEGLNSSVAVTQMGDGVRNFHVSGKIEASSEPQDMRLQRMLGHIPALVHPAPKTVLVVGCGAGVTAGSFVMYPTVERIVICELEPLIPKVVAEHFSAENYGVVKHKKVEVVYDDARHYILTTREKFDVITSDPINPWVKGAATLYTREYFELCKSRLNEGGVITQWVPLYESSLAAVKSELATFFDVFPEGTVWSNDVDGRGYDVVLLGQLGRAKIDVDAMQERCGRTDYFPVDESLLQVGFRSPIDLLSTFAGTAADLKPWLADAEINRDRNLRLQYLAGLAAHDYQEAAIYNEMLKHCRWPESLFVANPETTEQLKQRLRLDDQ
jgi:spermidine synthase